MAPSPVAAHPPNDAAHGIDESTYCTLWAGDNDTSTAEALRGARTGANSSGTCALAASTDIPLNTPPMAVERWNRGESSAFPATNASTSVGPRDATRRDGRFIKDAYIETFAIQPSTRARIAPNETPLYVAANGSVLATADYRVELPATSTESKARIEWSNVSHDITETRLVANGTTLSTTSGSHTPLHNYTLAEPNRPYEFRVEADIEVRARKHVTPCANLTNDTCTEWEDPTVTPVVETMTVTNTTAVVGYGLEVSGVRAVYPNGDLGLLVYKNRPWLGYTLPTGEVHGVWRFYSARDTGWDTLVTMTKDGRERTHSPLHPLQVNAYPFEAGATASPRTNVSIIETYGRTVRSPTLPENVKLDAHVGRYNASYGIATRTETTDTTLENVTAHGLVRGSRVQAETEPFADVPIHRSNLSLVLVNSTDNNVTVRATLLDANTSEPINTTDTDGYLVIQGKRTNTTGNGTVEVTVENPLGAVSARYEPEVWWYSEPSHVGDTTVVAVDGTLRSLLATAFRIAVPVGMFLFAGFLIDRITGWELWPPWRGL